jgi:hypothetical protein
MIGTSWNGLGTSWNIFGAGLEYTENAWYHIGTRLCSFCSFFKLFSLYQGRVGVGLGVGNARSVKDGWTVD